MNPRARVACVVALGVGLTLAPACKTTPSLGFTLSVPSDVVSRVAWYEVGVFTGSACPTIGPQLAGGVPATGYLERIAFASGSATPPLLQNLPRASYGIAVAARAADCSVVATGCADVNLASAKSVEVLLNDAATPVEGACIDGAVCNDARCTPGTSDVGAGCSLVLLGAGPLADPLLLGGGTVTSAPAVAATGDGFLIAYREDDVGDGIARVTVIPIDASGGAGSAQQTQQTTCVGTEQNDATGIVFSGASGAVGEARAGCGGNGGIDLYSVNATGALASDGFTPEGPVPLQFSTAHAMASSSAGTFVAYVQSNAATVAEVNGLAVGATAPFGGGSASDAWVAASDGLVALVAESAGGGGSSGGEDAGPPMTDAGATGGGADGGDGAADDGGAPASDDAGAGNEDASLSDDAGTPTPSAGVLSVNVIAASDGGASFASLPAPVAFAGTWASVSAQEGRVFVASDGQTSAEPIAYRAFDVGTTAPTVNAGFTTADVGPVLYTDVAFHQDHLFFAVERPGVITLVAFDNATTTPTPLRTVELASDPRIPSIAGVRDGRIAVVATDTLVLVAWTTEEVLTSNDATGGYALFACSTP